MFSAPHRMAADGWQSQRSTPLLVTKAGVVGGGAFFFHEATVKHKTSAANPKNAAGVPNPWERLAMWSVLPSIFAQDPHFARGKQITNTSEKSTLDLGVLSPKGETSYLMRVAVRKNNITIGKSTPGEIPQAMRSSKRGA